LESLEILEFPVALRLYALRPYAPFALIGVRGSFGWFVKGCHVERSARAIEENRRPGAMT
jgi:hypothetical protein